MDSTEMKKWVMSHQVPLLPPFNEKYQSIIFDSGVEKHVFVVADPATLKDTNAMNPIRDVAAALRGSLMFVLIDLEDEDSSKVVEYFGLSEHKKGIKLVGFEIDTSKKYLYKGDMTSDAIRKWSDAVLGGSAEVDYKSEEVPEGDAAWDGHVRVVVGKTVDSIVKDPKKDVLLEVYAPWCGHCKALAPTYKKLAKRFADVDSVVIAKMDGTANEHADVESEGFPTLLFFPADEATSSISYDEGDRSLLALTKFIKKHAKIPYELPKKKKEEDEEAEDSEDSDDDVGSVEL